MNIFYLVLAGVLLSHLVSAQSIGINNTLPDSSAILDIKSSDKGLLTPRTSTDSRLKIGNPAKGLLIYDTTTSSFWYYNATAWKEIRTDSAGLSAAGAMVEIEKSAADALISTSGLVPGVFYKISGVDTMLYNDGSNAGTTIILQAIENNKFATTGQGIFYNPKYKQAIPGFGVWSNRSTWTASLTSGNFIAMEMLTADNGATGQLFTNLEANTFIALSGFWQTATSIVGNVSGATANIAGVSLTAYTMGSRVMWGGYSWTNVSGATGAVVNIRNLNSEWIKDSYDSVKYNPVIDEISFDYFNNHIGRRYEAMSDNEVIYTAGDLTFQVKGNSISVFMWGNPLAGTGLNVVGVGGNRIKNSYCETVNFCGQRFQNNHLSGYSDMLTNTFAGNTIIYNNTLMDNSNIYLNVGSSLSIMNNLMANNCMIQSNIANNSTIDNNTITNESIISNDTLNTNSSIHHNTLLNNSSIQYNNLKVASIWTNTLRNYGFILNSKLVNSSIVLNELISGGTIRASLSGTLIHYCTFKNYSYFQPVNILTNKTVQYIDGDAGIINGNVSLSTIIYSNYPKTLYKRPDGISKLRYYNNNDQLVIANITD